jgi:LPS export ABC transporter protein LptC
MNKYGAIIAGILAAIVAALALILYVHNTKSVPASEVLPAPEQTSRASSVPQADLVSGQAISNFVLQNYNPRQDKNWSINARKAVIEDNVITLEDVEARGKDKGRNASSQLTAKKGVFDNETSELTLKENVAITTASGIGINTERLTWDTSKDRVSTDTEVTVRKAPLNARGAGGQVFLNKDFAQLDRDVRVEIKKDSTVTCKGPLKIYYKKNIAVFNSGVHMQSARGEIFADKMVVYFDAARDEIARVVCVGHVKIVRENSIAYCQKAEYIHKLSKVLLRGDTKIEFLAQ